MAGGIGIKSFRARISERYTAAIALCPRAGLTDAGIIGLHLLPIRLALGVGEQFRDHAHRPAGIMHMDDRTLRVGRFDLHRRVGRAGRRPADQKRNVKALALHLARQKHHLVQRGRDETRQADNVGLVLARGLQDFLRRHHDAQINHVIAITLQHDADDILADIVHIALHRRHDDKAVGLLVEPCRLALGLHIGEEMGDGLLHHAGGFHHLRQEHLALAEEVPHHVHPVHERAFNDVQRTLGGLAGFFCVFHHELI